MGTPVRDPHVQTMHYEVSSGTGISYVKPGAVSFSTQLGQFDLADGKLVIAPTEHFSNANEACSALDPFLRAWEIETDLNSTIGTIRFTYSSSEIIDRDPPPPGSPVTCALTGVAALTFAGSLATLHITRSEYPPPPKAFSITPNVQLVYRRWLGYRAGNEPLLAMAYFVLTMIKSAAGNDQKLAARLFANDLKILKKIGELSSTRGDESTARKAVAGKPFQGLTAIEKQWLEEAIRRVILRMGEHAFGGPLIQISLSDLPAL